MDDERDLLPLPDRARLVLAQQPLAIAICQVQFPEVQTVQDATFIAAFQTAISRTYPVASIQPRQIQVSMDPGGVRQQVSIQWAYADPDDTWHVVLAGDSLSLETRHYTHFEEFTERLQVVLTALFEHIRPSQIGRLGLRYVNEIRGSGMAWTDIIRNELLGSLADPALNELTTQHIGEVQLRAGEHHLVQMRHGWFPQGTTVRPRAGEPVSDQPFYLLDFDAFEDLSGSATPGVDRHYLCVRVATFHRNIYRLFRWAVSDDYLRRLVER